MPPAAASAASAAGAGAVFDHIVVGLGAAGSATLYELARRGLRVLGLEAQPAVAHDRGSSHGGSRIIRLVYQEHPTYVAWLRRCYDLWRGLERETGERLLHTTGCLNISAPGGIGAHGHSCFEGALASARAEGLPHEVLSAADMARRFPAYPSLPPTYRSLLDPVGGWMDPERSVQAMVEAAQRLGARVACNSPVVSWEALPGTGGVVVRTATASYSAQSVVLAAGPWMPALVPELAPLLQVERQVVGWFRPDTQLDSFAEELFPVFVLDDEEGNYYYGFPADGQGLVKVGKYHHLGQTGPADSLDRSIHPEDEATLRRCFERFLPALAGARMERAQTCMFTNTPDGHFLLAPHPAAPAVILASACSGHGFKFAPVLGEILADLAVKGATAYDLALHRIDPGRRGHSELLERCKSARQSTL